MFEIKRIKWSDYICKEVWKHALDFRLNIMPEKDCRKWLPKGHTPSDNITKQEYKKFIDEQKEDYPYKHNSVKVKKIIHKI